MSYNLAGRFDAFCKKLDTLFDKIDPYPLAIEAPLRRHSKLLYASVIIGVILLVVISLIEVTL